MFVWEGYEVCGFYQGPNDTSRRNPEVSLLIAAGSHCLDLLKTGRSKEWVMCEYVTTQRGRPENIRKYARHDVYFRDCVDLTAAGIFNGVEQCEKCIAQCYSKSSPQVLFYSFLLFHHFHCPSRLLLAFVLLFRLPLPSSAFVLNSK